jgi:hypothetical protein
MHIRNYPHNEVTDKRLRLLDNGFRPTPVHPHDSKVKSAGKQPMLYNWDKFTREAPTEDEVISWGEGRFSHNILKQNTGIALTSEIVAIDLDYTDPQLARDAYAITLEILGTSSFIRIGKAPKTMLFYRVDEQLEDSVLKKLADGSGQGVDILTLPKHGQARQVVVYGTHPDTKKDFHWPDENPLDSDISELPEIQNAQEAINRLLVALDKMAPFATKRSGKGSHGGSDTDIIRDAEGKITDGRDTFLRDTILGIGRDHFKRTGEAITEEQLADEAWSAFTSEANVCDANGKQKWFYKDALKKARSTIQRVADGRLDWGVSPFTEIDPYHNDDRVDVDTARTTTRDIMSGFMRSSVLERRAEIEAHAVAMNEYEASGGVLQKPVLTHVAPTLGMKIDTGVGKTTTALEELIKLLGDGTAKKAVLAIPTHDAADEKVKLAREMADDLGVPLTVHTYYGKGYKNPRDESRKVCDKDDLYSAISRAGGNPEKDLCSTCQFADTCYAKFQDTLKGDLWIIPSASLTSAPRKITDADIVVIDEEIAPSLVWGVSSVGDESNRPVKVPLTLLERAWKKPDNTSMHRLNDLLTAVLGGLRTPLEAEGKDRYVSLADITLNADEIQEGRSLLWQCKKIDIGYEEGDKADDLLQKDNAKYNLELRKLSRLLKELENAKRKSIEYSGRVKIIHGEDVNLGKYTVAQLCGMKPLSKQILEKPILRIDATLRQEIELEIFPNIEFLDVDIAVETPHMEVVQCPISASKAGVKLGDDGFNKGKHSRLRKILHMTEVIQAASPRGSLVITYKEAAKALNKTLKEQYSLPFEGEQIPHLHEVTNFKAHRGIDRWNGISRLLIYGRTRPNEESIEQFAMAVTGRYIEHQEYVKEQRGFTMIDGSRRGIEVDKHPDPFCDQVLQMIADDELVQAVGRARGVNRTADNKVQVIVMANRVLPVAVSKVVGSEELYPNRIEVALARNEGVIVGNANVLSEKHPDLWSTENAYKQDIHRNSLESNKSLLEILIGKCYFIKSGKIWQENINKPSKFIALAETLVGTVAKRLQDQLPAIAKIEGLDQFPTTTTMYPDGTLLAQLDRVSASDVETGLATPTGVEPFPSIIGGSFTSYHDLKHQKYRDTQAHNLKVGVAQSGSASASVAELDRASAFSAERTDNTKNIVLPEAVSVRRTMHPTKPKDVGEGATDITEVVVPKGYEPDVPSKYVGFKPSAFPLSELGSNGVAILSDDIPWPPDYEPQGLLTPPLAKGGIASLKLVDLPPDDLPPDNPPPDKVEEIRARLAEYCAFVGYACRSSGCELVALGATGLLQDIGVSQDTG